MEEERLSHLGHGLDKMDGGYRMDVLVIHHDDSFE